jgi:16S rRNA (uracil1498-N3)-methyltransferase
MDDEANHLIRVLRLGIGAEVDVFDGRGGMFRASVSAVSRDSVSLAIAGKAAHAPEPAVAATVVMSVLKGDKMDTVVRDVTMMGALSIQPVVSARSEISLTALARAHRTDRWQRIAIASVKQCGRAVVPGIAPPVSLEQCLRAEPPGAGLPVARIALVEPSAGHARSFSDVPKLPAIDLLIGPEGGWSPDELEMMSRAGVTSVSLGGRTLRAETAPLVALAALYEAWGAW